MCKKDSALARICVSFLKHIKRISCVSKCGICNKVEENAVWLKVGSGKIIILERQLAHVIAELEKHIQK